MSIQSLYWHCMMTDHLQVSLDELKRKEDETGVNRSKAYFHELIDAEIAKGIPSNRIVLGGFSQGGAMALVSGLTSPHKLGGVFGLSCYLLLKDKLLAMITDAGNVNRETKLFLAHGDEDQVVKPEFGKASAQALKEWGYNVDFRTYAYGGP